MGQKVSLYQGLTLKENVEFYAGLYAIPAGDLATRWGVLRERLTLGEAENERPENLPAGVRQRAGLALSTLHQPRVLFLDEPTAGVDVHNRALFWELIQDEADAGVTVFVTTHFLEEADYCDWVCFIDEGKLIADATPEDLRREHAGGYRVRLEADGERAAASRDRLRAEVAALHLASEATERGVMLVAPRLEGELLARLAAVAATVPGASLRIEQPQMTDIFRSVLARRTELARKTVRDERSSTRAPAEAPA
jgi:ABC-2 type transport system ATP-binding protein